METRRISGKEFDVFYSLLSKDFPYEERKSREDELAAFNNNKFNPLFILKNNKIVGYMCYWDFKNFIFGEHFAIVEKLRNNGIGTTFLREFVSNINRRIIIEVERPDTINAKRRIEFYKRLGFVVNSFDYFQPSYHKDEKEVPMFILSYKKQITESEYKEYFSEIKREVYNKKDV